MNEPAVAPRISSPGTMKRSSKATELPLDSSDMGASAHLHAPGSSDLGFIKIARWVSDRELLDMFGLSTRAGTKRKDPVASTCWPTCCLLHTRLPCWPRPTGSMMPGPQKPVLRSLLLRTPTTNDPLD